MAFTFDKTPKISNIDNDRLLDPMIEIRTDICPHCKAQSIELFSFNGYPQSYKHAVDAHLMGYDITYNKYEIRTMRCKSCNREFVIDWSEGFPKPLRSTYKTDRFFSEFVAGF